ncbi:MAG: phage integrase SAM-like domain-containing protein [Bacteroidetes bacterium]|nr:phage integrase SAM-like domain-containing protein [Bacteroidota bacterium]
MKKKDIRNFLVKEVDKFYDAFTEYLISQNLNNKSIGKYIQAYKTFVYSMVKKKIIAPVELDTWKVDRNPGTVIVLMKQN